MSAAAAIFSLSFAPWRGAAAAAGLFVLYLGVHRAAERIARRRPRTWLGAALGAIAGSVILLSGALLALARAGLSTADLAVAVALFAALHFFTLARRVRRAWGESDAGL